MDLLDRLGIVSMVLGARPKPGAPNTYILGRLTRREIEFVDTPKPPSRRRAPPAREGCGMTEAIEQLTAAELAVVIEMGPTSHTARPRSGERPVLTHAEINAADARPQKECNAAIEQGSTTW